ncbi:MAG: helix-turn-helix transcriptional regulator [Candidatus Izemoplasmatales bacterium]|nr:helix-turn-helix transcriptional regulator [Candidatus Izemoplasmatales bacterium]
MKDSISNQLYQILNQKNLSKIDMAQTLGVSEETLNQWLDSKKLPDEGMVYRIASTYGIPVDVLENLRRTGMKKRVERHSIAKKSVLNVVIFLSYAVGIPIYLFLVSQYFTLANNLLGSILAIVILSGIFLYGIVNGVRGLLMSSRPIEIDGTCVYFNVTKHRSIRIPFEEVDALKESRLSYGRVSRIKYYYWKFGTLILLTKNGKRYSLSCISDVEKVRKIIEEEVRLAQR